MLLCLDSGIFLYGSDGLKENMNFHNHNIDLEVDVKVTEVTKVKFWKMLQIVWNELVIENFLKIQLENTFLARFLSS